MTEFDVSREHQTTAEILDSVVGAYSQYALWGDTKAALEAILPHLEVSNSDPQSYGVNELYPFHHITNIGVKLNSTKHAEHFKNGEFNRHSDRSYEVQFEPVLDEAIHKGLPTSYFGFLLGDEVEMVHRYQDETEAYQPSIEYRRIGAPILLAGQFDKPKEERVSVVNEDTIDEAVAQAASHMWAQGAHGGEEFRAVKTDDAIKLCVALANELRAVGESNGLSESWENRLGKILANKDLLAKADEINALRESRLGLLDVSIDESGIIARLANSPDDTPFIGYRLSLAEDGRPNLESIGFMAEQPANDMDAIVFEQLLRFHTTDWIPFEKWVRETDQAI